VVQHVDHSRLEGIRGEMRDHLDHGLIPFWQDHALDHSYGGFLTNFDVQGHPKATPEKYLNTQARLTWWFSRLYRAAHPATTTYRALAEGGVDFLIKSLWDGEHGGWFWKVRQDGTRLDDGKVVYGQSFAIYALAEYGLATGDPRGLEYATRTFDLLQKYCTDTRWGGYYENCEPDWTISAPGFNAGDRKSLDTHMHLMEAFTTLLQLSGDSLHRRKLLELVDLICARMIDPVHGCGLNQFTLSWSPIPAIPIRRTWNAERVTDQAKEAIETTSYGHNTELAWLMRLALDVAGEGAALRAPLWHGLLTHAAEHGIDWQYGGIFRDGLRDGGAVVLEKEFWQHAEALVGFLDGYELFGEPRFLAAFESIWQFVKAYMLVPDVGEWRILLDRYGTPINADVGNPWKVAYHTGRSMLECLLRLDRLLA
jgi:mannose/cellobiose epimerase-like protein (N-acyl-D-glucosamine 2-epimerase family)